MNADANSRVSASGPLDRAGRRFVALALAGLLVTGTSFALPRQAPTKSAVVAHKAPPTKAAIAASAPTKTYGSPSAPIKLEIFTDYQCPICQVFYEQTLRYMISDYVASGKVYVVHHDFPLVMHQYSGQAARWANAAATVGEFEAVEAAFYNNQAAWSADGNLAKYVVAAMPKSDFDRVQAIMKGCTTPAPQVTTPGADPLAKSGTGCPVDQYIAKDIQLGNQDGVNATPTFIIYHNGQKITQSSGNVSWPILKQFFDTLLK